MKSFIEALQDGYTEDKPDQAMLATVERNGWEQFMGPTAINLRKSNWHFDFEDAEGNTYELWFEALLYDDQYYVALYKNEELMTEKVVIKPGKEVKANDNP